MSSVLVRALWASVALAETFVTSCLARPDLTFLGSRYCHPTPTTRLTSAPERGDLMHGDRGFNGGGRMQFLFHAIVSFNERSTQNAFV
ncbi:hypothetical protein B0H13DRAFT_2323668 [Mycena leptocephala]|nr:hypothetical protein B0H13DRAFT_2323668 [Mycena leptocephala]